MIFVKFNMTELLNENKKRLQTFEYNITKAFLEAQNEKIKFTKNDIIIACGSFFIMKEVRESLGYIDEIDPFEMNELSTNLKFGV